MSPGGVAGRELTSGGQKTKTGDTPIQGLGKRAEMKVAELPTANRVAEPSQSLNRSVARIENCPECWTKETVSCFMWLTFPKLLAAQSAHLSGINNKPTLVICIFCNKIENVFFCSPRKNPNIATGDSPPKEIPDKSSATFISVVSVALLGYPRPCSCRVLSSLALVYIESGGKYYNLCLIWQPCFGLLSAGN